MSGLLTRPTVAGHEGAVIPASVRGVGGASSGRLPVDDRQRHEGFPSLLPKATWEKLGNVYGLARQERRVLRLLCRGFGNATIAERLGIRPPTLRTHLRSIYKKLGCTGQVAVILKLVHAFVKKNDRTHPQG